MIRIKKILALVTASCLFLEAAFPAPVSAAGVFVWSITVVSPSTPPSPAKIVPGSNFVLKLAGANTTGVSATSPYVAFSATQTGYSLVNTGSGFVITGGVTTYYSVSGFNPPVSNTGTLATSLPTASASYGLSGTTIGIPTNYPHKTFDFTATFGATGLGPVSKTGSVAVDVVPHLRAASFSKSSIVNNLSDSAVLTVQVLDKNGCSDIASVRADMTSLGGAAAQVLSFQSCAGDGKTATYVSPSFTTAVGAGLKTISISVTDSAGNTQASDPNFSSEDLVSSASITVNTPSAPVVTISSVSPSLIRAGQSASVTWQSTQTGTYRVYAGPGAACGSGTPVESGNVTLANSDIVSTVTSAPLVEGSNPITVCVLNSEPTEGSNSSTIMRDSVAPVVNLISNSNNIVSQDVSLIFSANEAGTYRVYVNGADTGINGSYSGSSFAQGVTVPNALFTVDPGNNPLSVRVYDDAGNFGDSATNQVYKDGTPPPAVASVALSDCDRLANSGTVCSALGNPRSGMSGRDFSVTWPALSPTASGSFESYKVYVLPSGTAFTGTGGQTPSKTIFAFSQTGVVLDDSLAADSVGTPFSQTGSANYVAYVVVRKSNGLESGAIASSGATISADAITYPTFVSASFVSNTGIALTYSKPLSATLSQYDSSKLSSPGGCFLVDSTSGTGAKSVSGSTVTFSVEGLGNGGKTCSDLSALPGLVRDSEGLTNEDTATGKTVSDSQIPAISITSPTAGSYVAGAGVFTLLYALSETMSGATLKADFTDSSGSVVSVSLASSATAGNRSRTLTGSSVGLVDGKTYSLRISGQDLAGNSASSSSVAGIVYDVSAPSAPALASPVDNGYVKLSSPSLSWVGATDNVSSASAISYEVQVSLAIDFSAMFAFGNAAGGSTSYSVSPALVTNTGYYWRVRANDSAGNVGGWSAVKKFFFDNVAPAISSSASNTYVYNQTRSLTGYVKSGDALQLRSVVTDNYPAALYATGILANLSSFGGGSSVSAGSYASNQAVWNISATCADGTKTVAISASDAAGNSSNQNVSAICDNTAPAVTDATVTAPAASSFVSGGSSTNVTWNTAFYSSEASPIANPVTLEYSSNGGSNWTVIAASVSNGGNVAWTVPSVDVSNFKVRLTAKDLLGNTASGTSTFTVDSTNPSVASDALTYPNGGEYLKGSTGTGITVLWNPAKISDTNIHATPVTLEYSTGGAWNPVASGLANNGSYLWSPGTLDSNSVRIRLTATDKVGRTSSDVSDAVFSVDSTLPTVTVSAPPTPPDNSFVSGSGFDVGVSGTDLNLAKVSYSFTDGSFYWNESSTSWLGGTQWNDLCTNAAACANHAGTVSPAVSDGSSYQLVFRSTDRAGNVKDSAVFRYVGDLVSPTATTSVSTGSYFSGAVLVSGTSADARSGVSSVKVSFLRNSDGKYFASPASGFSSAVETFLAASTSNAYANWSYTGFSVPAGDPDGTTYSLTVLWTDKAYKFNNETRTGATFIKDASGPAVAADVWTMPGASGLFWNGSTVKTLTWNPAKITDALSGVNSASGVTVEYSTGGIWNPVSVSVSNSGSTNWTVPLIDADVNFRITAKDALGNVSAGVVSPAVTVDSLPPQISTVETLDRAASGKVDGFLVTMSEPIKCSTLRVQDFTVSGIGAASATSGCATTSSTFVVEFSATWSTSTTPTLSFLNGGTLADRAGNLLAAVTKTSVDKAVPRLLSASVTDANSNGKIDRIVAVFSESLQAATDTAAWSLVSAPVGMGTAPLSVSVSGNSATLALNEPTAHETSTGGLRVAFAAGSVWKDSQGNLAAPKVSQTLADSANPRVVSAVTAEDAQGNYALDIAFSEALSGSTLAGFSLSGSATYSGSYSQTGLKTFRFRTADTAATNTAKPYSYSYAPWVLADLSGNALAAIGSVSFADGIAPKILTKKTRDANGNGKIDSIVIEFSEALNGNVSGVSASVAGYVATAYASSGTGLTVTVTERTVADTDAAPNVQVSNASLADAAGNPFPSESSASQASDSVGPVIVAVRYDGTNKITATLSEPYSGTPSTSWFVFSGTSVSATAASSVAADEVELTVTGTVTYGTTSVSVASNAVADASGNRQSAASYVAVSATVVINEVMWSSSGSSLTQYVELRNLGPSPIDVSGFKIDAASVNGTATLTLPASQSIAGNGYYLIAASAVSTAGNQLSPGVTPNYVGALSFSPSQASNLVLKNSAGSVYDRAKANPFPAGSDAPMVSMERKDTPGDGLSASNWYGAQTGSTFFDSAAPKGTPGSANVFDAAAPTISSATPADGALLPTGSGVTVSYAYSDDVFMSASPSRTFKLEKNDGSGNYSDVTAASVSSSGADASNATYSLGALASGGYRTTFTVRDAAGNSTQKISVFYVDAFSLDVSSGSVSLGTLDAGVTGVSAPLTVTVKTVGAPFSLVLSGGTLSSGADSVAAWNGSAGYGFGCAPSGSAGASVCNGSVRAATGSVLDSVASASPDTNGNLKTYVYAVAFSAKVDSITSAGEYSADHVLSASFSY